MFEFLDPLPPVMHIIHATSFLSSAFWGPPSPTHCGRHIWKPPYISTSAAVAGARRCKLQTASRVRVPFISVIKVDGSQNVANHHSELDHHVHF